MQRKLGQPTQKASTLFFILFFSIGALLAVSVALFYRAELNIFLSEMKAQERQTLRLQSISIGNVFDGIVSDLLFLSLQNELHRYLEREDAQIAQAIQAEYIAMSAVKKIYDQIRYLDDDGMERVRVNFADGRPATVPDKELQDKSRRYYFTDTFVLGEKEIFVSPLDLNVESGMVEQPFKPMIRFGTPVFDNKGNKRGIVLLNYLAANLLDLIDAERAGSQSSNMLVNADGYWLLHPEKEKEWGFMLEDRAGISLAEAYPEEWRKIREQRAGQIQSGNGLFTFTSIYPLQEGYRSSSGSGEPYKPSMHNLDSKEYFWVLLTHIPSEVIAGHTQALMNRLLIISAGLFILISYGAWQLALAITRRRIYEAQLIEMALTDDLTGLPNRKLFFDRLEEDIAHADRHGRRLALLYIDLDKFKDVNDTLGHNAGDELLIQVAVTLKKILRKSDTVARLGGDEFAVILVEINELEDARRVGKKVVAMLCRSFELKAGTVRIGASVGAAVFPDHEDTADAMIKHADDAMYKAKSKGKNNCVMAELN